VNQTRGVGNQQMIRNDRWQPPPPQPLPPPPQPPPAPPRMLTAGPSENPQGRDNTVNPYPQPSGHDQHRGGSKSAPIEGPYEAYQTGGVAPQPVTQYREPWPESPLPLGDGGSQPPVVYPWATAAPIQQQTAVPNQQQQHTRAAGDASSAQGETSRRSRMDQGVPDTHHPAELQSRLPLWSSGADPYASPRNAGYPAAPQPGPDIKAAALSQSSQTLHPAPSRQTVTRKAAPNRPSQSASQSASQQAPRR
jgi:hypothetical protein